MLIQPFSWANYLSKLRDQLVFLPLSDYEKLLLPPVHSLPVGFDKDIISVARELQLPQENLDALNDCFSQILVQKKQDLKDKAVKDLNEILLSGSEQDIQQILDDFLLAYPVQTLFPIHPHCTNYAFYVGVEYRQYFWVFYDVIQPALNHPISIEILKPLFDFIKLSSTYENEKRYFCVRDLLERFFYDNNTKAFEWILSLGMKDEMFYYEISSSVNTDYTSAQVDMILMFLESNQYFSFFRFMSNLEVFEKYPRILSFIIKNCSIKNLQAIIFKSVDKNNHDMIKKIIQELPWFDLNFKNNKGLTPYQQANAKGYVELSQFLLNHGALPVNQVQYYTKYLFFRFIIGILPKNWLSYNDKEVMLRTELAHLFSLKGDTTSDRLTEDLEGYKVNLWLTRYHNSIEILHDKAFYELNKKFKDCKQLNNINWQSLSDDIFYALKHFVRQETIDNIPVLFFGTFSGAGAYGLPTFHAIGAIETVDDIYYANRGFTYIKSKNPHVGLMRYKKHTPGFVLDTLSFEHKLSLFKFESWIQKTAKHVDTFDLSSQTVGNCVYYSFDAMVAGLTRIHIEKHLMNLKLPHYKVTELMDKLTRAYLFSFNVEDKWLLINEYQQFRQSMIPYDISGRLDLRLHDSITHELKKTPKVMARHLTSLQQVQDYYQLEQQCQRDNEPKFALNQYLTKELEPIIFSVSSSPSCVATYQLGSQQQSALQALGATMSLATPMVIGTSVGVAVSTAIGLGLAIYGSYYLAKSCLRKKSK